MFIKFTFDRTKLKKKVRIRKKVVSIGNQNFFLSSRKCDYFRKLEDGKILKIYIHMGSRFKKFFFNKCGNSGRGNMFYVKSQT